MPKLYVTEFSGYLVGGVQAPVTPPLAEARVDFSGGAAASPAFGVGTKIVRLEADATCSIAWGTDPTATTANMRLAADTPEYFVVAPGLKVSAIINT